MVGWGALVVRSASAVRSLEWIALLLIFIILQKLILWVFVRSTESLSSCILFAAHLDFRFFFLDKSTSPSVEYTKGLVFINLLFIVFLPSPTQY